MPVPEMPPLPQQSSVQHRPIGEAAEVEQPDAQEEECTEPEVQYLPLAAAGHDRTLGLRILPHPLSSSSTEEGSGSAGQRGSCSGAGPGAALWGCRCGVWGRHAASRYLAATRAEAPCLANCPIFCTID